MNLKASIAVHVSEEIGSKLEDGLERARGEVFKAEGQRAGALLCFNAINHLLNVVNKDRDEGKLDDEQAVFLKPWLERAAHACDGVAKQAENALFTAQGQVKYADAAVIMVRKVRDGHAAKLQPKLEEAAPTEGHPGPSLKDERQAEEAEHASDPG